MNRQVSQDLLALLKQSRENGPKVHKTETTAEEYAQTENSETLSSVIIPFAVGMKLHFEPKRNVIRPCMVQELRYNVNIYKSSARDELGQLRKGTSIVLAGYPVETDSEGQPLFDTVEVDGNEVRKPRLITTDSETGEPTGMLELMEWRPFWGEDRSKSDYNRPSSLDMLVLNANRGVPRKNIETTGTNSTETRIQRQVAWELISGIEDVMRKPLLNAMLENNEGLLDFIENIEVTANAPSQRKAKTEAASNFASPTETVKGVAIAMPTDPFASAPEAKEATPEAPSEEKAEKPKPKK